MRRKLAYIFLIFEDSYYPRRSMNRGTRPGGSRRNQTWCSSETEGQMGGLLPGFPGSPAGACSKELTGR
jgi:hypothetical protein